MAENLVKSLVGVFGGLTALKYGKELTDAAGNGIIAGFGGAVGVCIIATAVVGVTKSAGTLVYNRIKDRKEREKHENLLSASTDLVWRLYAFWKG